jgi:site-specific DNA-cytosine methylase
VSGLVLSLFSGAGLLDHAFAAEGFCVVSAGDVIGGSLYDIRQFHPPVGRFDGIVGGDPCQSHSALANLVRAKGLEPSFPDLTGEFQRVVEEARPAWFLRENVPRAPDVKPVGYDVRSFLLDNWASLGEEQQRRRRFWFGVREGPCPELRRWIEFALFIPAEMQAVCGDARAVPVALGGSGKVKRTAVQGGHDATLGNRITAQKRSAASCDGRQGHRIPDGTGQFRKAAATGRHPGAIGVTGGHKGNAHRYTLAEMCELQGLPADFLDHSPFMMQGKRKLIGNGVALPTGRAIAKAIRKALETRGAGPALEGKR